MATQQMEQLRALLRLLALPVTGQMRLIPGECDRMEQLAGILRSWRQELPPELVATLTPGQERVLLELEHQLVRACAESASPFWTDRAMRQSDGVRQARWLAREALVRFGWSLALPAGELTQIFAAAGFARGSGHAETQHRRDGDGAGDSYLPLADVPNYRQRREQ